MSNDHGPIRIDLDDRHDTLRLIPWWDQTRLAQSRVLVIGAGALGNEAIKNLTLLGVGQIAVVDMDHIESSNLSRSVLFRQQDAGRAKGEVVAQRAAEIDPAVRIIPLVANVIHEVGLGWFADADVVLGCLDNREARLWVNRCCWHTGTPWIDAGIQEISGVVQVFVPPDGTCYECGMKEADYRLINLRYSCPLLRAEDVQRGRVPTTPTIGSIIAGWQVQEAVKLIHGLPTASSSALVFHGMTNNIYRTQLPRREDCLSHDSWVEPQTLPTIDGNSTVRELLQAASIHQGSTASGIRLTRDLLTAMNCQPCGTSEPHLRLRGLTAASLAKCPQCGDTRSPEMTQRIAADDSFFAERPLKQLGIPTADLMLIEFDEAVIPFRGNEETFAKADTHVERAGVKQS